MNKSLLIAHPSSQKLKKAHRACTENNCSVFLAKSVEYGLLATQANQNFSVAIVDLYLPARSTSANEFKKIPQGLTLILKCLEFSIPVIIISADEPEDSKYLNELVEALETHTNFYQNNIPVFFGTLNWQQIVDKALSLKQK